MKTLRLNFKNSAYSGVTRSKCNGIWTSQTP